MRDGLWHLSDRPGAQLALIAIPIICAAILLLLVLGFQLDPPVAISLAGLLLLNGLARLWVRRRL